MVRIVFPTLNGTDLELGFTNGTPGNRQDLNINTAGNSRPSLFTQLGNKLVFVANDETYGSELWITDGTPGGTEILRNINTGVASGLQDYSMNYLNAHPDIIRALIVVGNTLYFTATNGTSGFELWKSDGTTVGTEIVKNIAADPAGSFPTNFVEMNGLVYFIATGATGVQIWQSNGTDAGTVPITNFADPMHSINQLTVSGGKLFFSYYDGTMNINAEQLYVHEGTPNVTTKLTNGILGVRELTDVNGTLYFHMNDTVHGLEPWKSDGTTIGTELVFDISPGGGGNNAPSSQPFAFTFMNGWIYFNADDGSLGHGREIWRTDGAGTTERVTDIFVGPTSGVQSNQMIVFNNELYFAAQDSAANGFELWKTTGTPGNATLVKNLAPDMNASGTPVLFEVIDGTLYFVAYHNNTDKHSLWKTDGTGPNTVLITGDYDFGGGYQTFGFLLNTPPTVAVNTGANVNEAQFVNITTAMLDTNDAEQADADIVYTVTTLPAHGELRLNGVALVLNGTFTQADVNSGLVTYVHDGSETPASDSFGFSVGDGEATVTGQTFALTVTANNDAPEGQPSSITLNEDTPYTLLTTDFPFTDVEGNALVSVRITTVPGTGTLANNGVTLAGGETISVADITAGKLIYTPAANANGNALVNFTFQVADNGGTLNGGNDLDGSPATMTINVTPVNDAPSGTNAPLIIQEDITHVFAAGNFGFTDAADGNALAAVIITTLPALGTIRLDGVAVTAGQEISALDIANGKLTYRSPADANGAGYASFSFQVKDNGGTANTGVDTDQTPNMLSFEVNPVNDAPILVTPIADQVAPVAGLWTFQIPPGTFTDIDGDLLGYTTNQADGTPIPPWLSFSQSTQTFSGNPPGADTLSLRVYASDGFLTVDDVFDVTFASNIAPVGVADTANVLTGLSVTGNVLTNDTDANNDVLTTIRAATSGGALQAVGPGGLVLAGTRGTLTIQQNGSYNYAATAGGLLVGQTVQDVFTYQSGDGALDSNTTTLTISVTGNGTGTPGADTMRTAPGGATIDGLAGNDLLVGDAGSDTINGGADNDTLDGGTGGDTLNGGTGNDTASYVYAPAAVLVNLGISGPQNTGGSGSDALSGIENLAGSSFDDTLIGDGGDNILAGGDGNDVLEGGAGIDTLIGGNGIDTASYAFATAGVSVSLAIQDAFQNTASAGSDFLSGIENLAGSAHGDILNGNAGVNIIAGGAGADIIRGGGGGDVLVGGAGGDYFALAAASDSTLAAPDIITDFEIGVDKIDFRFIRTSAADSVSISTASGFTLVTLDLGGNGTPDVRVLLSGAPAITAADILLTVPMATAESIMDDQGYLLS